MKADLDRYVEEIKRLKLAVEGPKRSSPLGKTHARHLSGTRFIEPPDSKRVSVHEDDLPDKGNHLPDGECPIPSFRCRFPRAAPWGRDGPSGDWGHLCA